MAARYQPGQPLGALEAVARRAGDLEMTEIPQGRCLLVRTWPENGEPDHGVVADGRWLVFDVSLCVPDTPARSSAGNSSPQPTRPAP